LSIQLTGAGASQAVRLPDVIARVEAHCRSACKVPFRPELPVLATGPNSHTTAFVFCASGRNPPASSSTPVFRVSIVPPSFAAGRKSAPSTKLAIPSASTA
jgi:hypothetical protein